MVRIPTALKNVLVRSWSVGDREALAEQANDREVWLNLRDAFPHPYTLDDADRFLARVSSMQPETYFAIEVDGSLAGGIGCTLREDVERVGAEVGYWIGRRFRSRGVATAAVRAVTLHAFEAHAHLERLYAVPFASNPASARVLEKAGYAREAVLRRAAIKDGRLLDQFLYAILREEVLRP